MHKTNLKALFSKFCLLEIIVRPFISLTPKFEEHNFLASKLEHFENEIHFCHNIQYTVTLTTGKLIISKKDDTNISLSVYLEKASLPQ